LFYFAWLSTALWARAVVLSYHTAALKLIFILLKNLRNSLQQGLIFIPIYFSKINQNNLLYLHAIQLQIAT
jgi:hypothetical protein